MTCEQWREDISAWIDGELTPYRTRQVAQHARTCSECRRTLDSFRKIASLAQAAPVPRVAPHVTDAAMSLVRAGHRRRLFWQKTVFSFSWPKITLAVSSVALAVMLAFVFEQNVFNSPHDARETPGPNAVQADAKAPPNASAEKSSGQIIAGELSVADSSVGAERVTAFAQSLGGNAYAVRGQRGSTVMVTIPSASRETFISGLSELGRWHSSTEPASSDGSATVGIKITEQR